jgi:dolichol-phosphate mannosyltransferase
VAVELSVVIPAYLEEENLRVVLPRLLAVLRETGLASEVLVVDTEQPLDNTRAVCEAAGVAYVPRAGGNRYADAVRTGIARARGRWVLFMDADGSHMPEFIPRLLEHAPTHDIVIASRYVEGGATENPASLIWMSRALNLIYTLVLRIPCRDVSNSFKLYRGDMLKDLSLSCAHFDVIEEILVKCAVRFRPLRIREVPFVFKARMFGQTKRDLVTFVFSFAATLGRLLWIRLRAGRPALPAPAAERGAKADLGTGGEQP